MEAHGSNNGGSAGPLMEAQGSNNRGSWAQEWAVSIPVDLIFWRPAWKAALITYVWTTTARAQQGNLRLPADRTPAERGGASNVNFSIETLQTCQLFNRKQTQMSIFQLKTDKYFNFPIKN